jgi:hypothetical protein
MLGEFAYLLIAPAAELGEKAYGAAIRAVIEASTRTKVLHWRALYDHRTPGNKGAA